MGEFTIWQRRPCFPVLFEKFCIILIRPCTFVSLIAFLDLTLTTLIASVLIFLTDQQKRPVILCLSQKTKTVLKWKLFSFNNGNSKDTNYYILTTAYQGGKAPCIKN